MFELTATYVIAGVLHALVADSMLTETDCQSALKSALFRTVAVEAPIVWACEPMGNVPRIVNVKRKG